MADTLTDSRVTYAGGRKGFVIGALAGAVIAGILGLFFASMEFGNGGPGLHIMAGAVFGGLAGLMIGAIRSRPRD
jgi:hypothetical protein